MARANGKLAVQRLGDAVWFAMRALSDAEVRAAIRRTRALSTTNCAWWEYQMRETLEAMLETEKKIRQRVARQKRRAPGPERSKT